MVKPIRVFLVNDDHLFSEGIRRLLELKDGIAVVGEAASAEESFEKVGAQAVDVVLMDIRLTSMDGIEATRQLRVERPDLKVIMLSSFGNEYLVQAIEAGAHEYILKSATRCELADAVVQVDAGQLYLDPKLTKYLWVPPDPRPLSPRRRKILQLTADGMRSKEIEKTLSIARSTLTREKHYIYEQFGAIGLAHTIAEAFRRGLIK